jgi:gamma-glutamyl:cysteine ligase YbdK (ATP-grasp superfamily)
MFEAIAPEDPAGEMQHEWLNARGAIARFERGSIEIRVIDSQESLVADQIVALAVVELTRALAQEHLSSYDDQKRVPHEALVELFGRSIREADQARTHDPAYLRALGLSSSSASVNEIWRAIAPRLPEGTREPLLEQIHRGPLARRLLASAGPTITRPVLESILRELMQCLAGNRFYRPDQQR